jgi:hypothetical protein
MTTEEKHAMSNSMHRRHFLGSTVVAATAATLTSTYSEAAQGKQEYYELRTYKLDSAEKQKALLAYASEALVPALNRMGLDRVGAFVDVAGKDHDVRVLIPFPTLETFSNLIPKLAANATYTKAAASHFSGSKKDAPYTRISSQFMKAFASMPKIELPSQTAAKKPRLLELRTYESHDEDAALRKVEMFDKGETQLMRDVKLEPVMFGQMMIGHDVPNLTYMLSADDAEAHKAHWKAFLSHPEWDKMKKNPRYKGTVSKITNWFLKPTDFSQI